MDLITTSRDILIKDLKGVQAFRYVTSQFAEIQSAIGKMLLGDFKDYIAKEIDKDIEHIRATIVASHPPKDLGELETQLTGVIYGLLRQNSYTFLEVLEDAR